MEYIRMRERGPKDVLTFLLLSSHGLSSVRCKQYALSFTHPFTEPGGPGGCAANDGSICMVYVLRMDRKPFQVSGFCLRFYEESALDKSYF